MPSWTDEDMLRGIQQGDNAAYRAYFAAYGRSIHYYLQAETRDCRDAEQLHQDVLLKAIATWNPEGGKSLKNWLFMLARQALAGHFRGNSGPGPRDVSIEELEELHLPTPRELQINLQSEQEEGGESELTRQFHVLIEQLPPRLKLVATLWLRDYSDDQIAEYLGVKTGTVRVQKHRVAVALRALIDASGGERRFLYG